MSDELYTPAWVFDAIGVRFDLDVAAPPGGPLHVPAARYYTAADDGLAAPWCGVVWCNPPYSRFTQWARRWCQHDQGALLGFYAPESAAFREVMTAADAVVFVSMKFERPEGPPMKPRHGLFVAFRGMGTEVAVKVANANRFGVAMGPLPPFSDRIGASMVAKP